MNKNIILTIFIVAVIFIGVIWFLGNRGDEEVALPTQIELSPSPSPSPTPTPRTLVTPKIITVNMADSGFSPNEVTINAGDTVKFVNQSSQSRWPASAVHPTHELYPGSGISRCGSLGPMAIFDACRGLKTGESFSFIFNSKGSWPYHDHLAPSVKGIIIVQ